MRPFELTRPPLLRVYVCREREASEVLVLTVHHGVFDGGSLGVFLKELGEAYTAYEAGSEPSWSELGCSYTD
ncbi:MAG: hypothetical protein RL685_792 [Pseudomonadota bacterium]|jgi:NRPS condensation-like uncharacterized protein